MRLYPASSAWPRLGAYRKATEGSDNQPASKTLECFGMGGSSSGPCRSDPDGTWQPRGIPQGVAAPLCQLRGYTIWLYVDRARWHRGDPIREFLRKHKRLRIVYLPPYQPALNMQERIWRQIRYESTTNRWFDNLDAIWATVQKTLDSWSKRKIRRLCNIT